MRSEHVRQQHEDKKQLKMVLEKKLVFLQHVLRNPAYIINADGVLTLFGQGLCESPEARQAVSSQLVQDTRQHLSQLLGLSVASNGEGVGCEGGLHFRIVEVDHCSLICKHVNLEEIKFFTTDK